jgi:glutamyl-tRNA reductase
MQTTFQAYILSYKSAPLEMREQVALSESEARQLMRFIQQYAHATDLLVVSTCNRTEVYYSSEEPLSKVILQGISLIKGIQAASLEHHFQALEGNEALLHLFRVSVGLESQVVGDLQISGQVKDAYQWSADEQMAGPFLHRLMHTIFFANKRVVQETTFRDGAASVSYATKELVEDLVRDFAAPKVLILGLGEIGREVTLNLVNSKVSSVRIANRTETKAVELAAESGFEHVPFAEVWEAIATSDVVVCSIANNQPFITSDKLKELTILSHKFFVDLSVPRSVEAGAEEIPGVLVYNIDDVRGRSDAALQKRLAAIPQVEAIIDQMMGEFQDWSKEMVVSPTIQKLKNALEQIRTEELTRVLKNASQEEAKILDQVTKNMMQKVMKLPVLQLKAACKRGEADSMIEVINELFDLEKRPVSTKK